VVESPFSELINQWLEEGERLSQLGDAVPFAAMPGQRSVWAVLARARVKIERNRGAAFMVAVAVSALAIFAMRTVVHSVLASDPPAADAKPAFAADSPTPPATLPSPVAAATAAANPEISAPADETPPAAEAESAPTSAPSAAAVAAVVEPVAVAPAPAPEGPAPLAATDSLAACRKALRNERARKALIACRHASDANPGSAEAAVLLAHADLLAGRQDETLKHARRASALDPSCAEAYLLIGNVQQMSGSTPAARAAYQAYLQLAPRGPHAAEVRAILRTL